MTAQLADGEFTKIHLLDFPADVLDLGDEIADIVRTLKDVSVSFKEDGGSIVISIHVSAENEGQAELIRQLTQGMIGVYLASVMAEEMDEVDKLAIELFKNTSASRDGNEVVLRATVSSELLIEFLREEADLPL